jgi:perosamine synthetase
MKKIEIPVSKPFIGSEEAKAVYDTVLSGWLRMGNNVEKFEQIFAQYVGAKHAIAMGNGTQTLHALLAALGIGPGDEVIIPTLNYISAANVVLYQGAKLVLCDADPNTLNTTASLIEPLITKRTKAIMPVDLNGMPIDFDEVIKLGEQYNIPIIADSAESFGASYKNEPVGTQALAHSFSFFPNKNITTGEGGMITTENDDLAKKLRILRNQGQEGRYNHTHLGFNYRMTEMQAAIGLEQMKKIDGIIIDKNRIVNRYNELFTKHSFITVPFVPDYVTQHAWFMYTTIFDRRINRDEVKKMLEDSGVETRVCFKPIHLQPYLKGRFDQTHPNSDFAYQTLINLPIWYGLGEKDIEYVAEKVIDACRKYI